MVSEWERDLAEELNDAEFAKAYGAETVKSEFGLALLHARLKSKLTQKQLSEKLGLRQPYISQLESGEANPTLSTIGEILSVMGLKVVLKTVPLKPEREVYIGEVNKQLSLVSEKKARYRTKQI